LVEDAASTSSLLVSLRVLLDLVRVELNVEGSERKHSPPDSLLLVVSLVFPDVVRRHWGWLSSGLLMEVGGCWGAQSLVGDERVEEVRFPTRLSLPLGLPPGRLLITRTRDHPAPTAAQLGPASASTTFSPGRRLPSGFPYSVRPSCPTTSSPPAFARKHLTRASPSLSPRLGGGELRYSACSGQARTGRNGCVECKGRC